MDYRLIVYDDFFMHPNEIRKKALEQTFNQLGNYPGIRTDRCKNILPEMYRELKLSLEPLIPKNSTITARFQKQGKTGEKPKNFLGLRPRFGGNKGGIFHKGVFFIKMPLIVSASARITN